MTYVIHIEIEQHSLFEKNNQNLLRGRTEGLLSVYEMLPDGGGKRVYTRDIRTRHPRLAPPFDLQHHSGELQTRVSLAAQRSTRVVLLRTPSR
ncbi:MAG: hypothetical protein CM1200mP2_34100 [Planctomycetaceae bacterium]|nr:MAG: hypothetical protein CM1200mP2_34100 [Planctomycetaceae bacterium]